MKLITKQDKTHCIRFDRGEEVIEGLQKFCAEHNLAAAHFTAIGAAQELVLSFYDLSLKKYEDSHIKDNVEITSLTGNIAKHGEDIVVHCHGNFSDRVMKVFGGHVKN